jgi:NAD(P)-dependent dehydrogenase (short-subunit alcohol dehydrogenase family)
VAVTLITGAGSGIGAAAAHVFAARGHVVACVDVDLDRAAQTAEPLGASAVPVYADVTDLGSCEVAVAATIDRFGDIDHVVTCAGIEAGGDALEIDPALFRRVLDVNVMGSYLMVRAAARAMRELDHGGAMVLIGSIASYMSFARSAPYSASKGGVLQLGKALAVDLAPLGIRVNVIGPGVTDTPMSAASLADPDRRARYMSRIPLDRPADPREIAQMAFALCSQDASYVTGAFLPVDGGWLAD